MKKISIGYDYGSDSARAIAVDVSNGNVLTQSVFKYPQWAEQMYCNALTNQFRQHPQDYIDAFIHLSHETIDQLKDMGNYEIIGIGVDTTGSTPIPVNEQCIPLSLTEEFKAEPDAMAILWKDHSSHKEAEQITNLAKSGKYPDYTKYTGGAYSSEWFWAKALHIININPKLSTKISSFVEHSDWMCALITGVDNLQDLKRNRCGAGHKAMWNKEFNGVPSVEFFNELNPKLGEISQTFASETHTSDEISGYICKKWADKTGLPVNIPVAMGIIDAHAGAIGAGITENTMCRVMGTSICDILVTNNDSAVIVNGISGQVDGSVIPHKIAYESGQSSFGDAFAWFKNMLSWTLDLSNHTQEEINIIQDNILINLEKEALKIENNSEFKIIALDWLNGRRSPNVNPNLASGFYGLTLGTTAPEMYKALVDSTNMGARAILDNYTNHGVKIDKILCLGGIPKKSKLIMQSLADILQKDCHIVENEQCCALGSAILGAVVGKEYPTIEQAYNNMASKVENVYKPNEDLKDYYEKAFKNYQSFAKFAENQL